MCVMIKKLKKERNLCVRVFVLLIFTAVLNHQVRADFVLGKQI